MRVEPKRVNGALILAALLGNVKSEKFLTWYTTNTAPQPWSVHVEVLQPDASESDLQITICTPHGEYSRVYTVAEQIADAKGA